MAPFPRQQVFFFFSSRRRHTRLQGDWSSDVCSSDLALLFERPTLLQGGPSRYPVAVNLFGSEKRMALALGVSCLDEIGGRIATPLHNKVPPPPLGQLAPLPHPSHGAEIPPKTGGGRAPA